MKDIEKLKKQLKEDSSFREKFKNVKDADEAISLANNLGYKVTKEDFDNDNELNEDLLEAVSGGKNSTKLRINHFVMEDGSSIYRKKTDKTYNNNSMG